MKLCPSCQSPNEDSAGFCDQCGSSLANALPSGSGKQAAVSVVGGNQCPSCGAATVPGEAYCDNCGAALNAPPTSTTTPSFTPPPPVLPAYTPSGLPTPRLIHASGQTFSLSGKTSYLIGREDPVSGVFPEVDTSATDGMNLGVGRRHAELFQQGGQWFIQDLDSVNHTFVNHQRLTPKVRQPINVGDQIRCGKWLVTFQA